MELGSWAAPRLCWATLVSRPVLPLVRGVRLLLPQALQFEVALWKLLVVRATEAKGFRVVRSMLVH